MVIRLRPCMISSTPPTPPPSSDQRLETRIQQRCRKRSSLRLPLPPLGLSEQAKATRDGSAVQHEGSHQRREGGRQDHAVAPAAGSPVRRKGECIPMSGACVEFCVSVSTSVPILGYFSDSWFCFDVLFRSLCLMFALPLLVSCEDISILRQEERFDWVLLTGQTYHFWCLDKGTSGKHGQAPRVWFSVSVSVSVTFLVLVLVLGFRYGFGSLFGFHFGPGFGIGFTFAIVVPERIRARFWFRLRFRLWFRFQVRLRFRFWLLCRFCCGFSFGFELRFFLFRLEVRFRFSASVPVTREPCRLIRVQPGRAAARGVLLVVRREAANQPASPMGPNSNKHVHFPAIHPAQHMKRTSRATVRCRNTPARAVVLS